MGEAFDQRNSINHLSTCVVEKIKMKGKETKCRFPPLHLTSRSTTPKNVCIATVLISQRGRVIDTTLAFLLVHVKLICYRRNNGNKEPASAFLGAEYYQSHASNSVSIFAKFGQVCLVALFLASQYLSYNEGLLEDFPSTFPPWVGTNQGIYKLWILFIYENLCCTRVGKEEFCHEVT